MRLLALLFLVGCTPKIAWGIRDNPATLANGGTCKATLRVKVVDASGAPVAGAEVFVRVRERTHAPSVMPVDHVLETVSARTNKHGEAKTCPPKSVPTYRDGFFASYADAIIARVNGKESSLGAPFIGLLMLQ